MHHSVALKLARQGKFDNLTRDLLRSPAKSDVEWRNKMVAVQSIELYKHFHGLPNDFCTYTKLCSGKGFEKQQASVLNNQALKYRAQAVDLLAEAEKHCKLPENLTIIKLNKALYSKDADYLQCILPDCTTSYTTAQAMAIGGILFCNDAFLHYGIELLFKLGCKSDILWLQTMLQN